MGIDSSDFIAQGTDNAAQWSRETAFFLLTRQQVGGRLLLRKSLKPQFLNDSRLRETLRKEYEIGTIVGMGADYVVNYYQMVDTPDECYLTMDFIEGSTLAELLLVDPDLLGNSITMERAFVQLLEALRSFHRNQVVHLDLKPSNIMLTHVSHDIRIIDLGFCYADAYQESMGMTDGFSAPEQRDGTGDVDARTDIYAIGRLLQYFEQELGKKCKWRNSRIYKKLVSRCLAEQKKERWQSVDEMIDFLIQNHKSSRLQYASLSTLAFFCVLSIIYYVFQLPVTGGDKHVLYGNFSLLDSTCEAVGKIADDGQDPHWQGNIYVYSSVKHWGKTYDVVGIADKAFYRDSSFNTIYLPTSITRIGTSAFEECSHLESIHLPNGINSIGQRAFLLATSLAEVKLPASLLAIPANCFLHCPFTTITIPEGVTSIELDAFGYSSSLRQITLPQSLLRMERGVFWCCESLESISLPANLQTIGEYAFMGCTKLKQIENHATDPQSVMSLFDDSIPDLHLLVPPASINEYKQAPEWNRLVIEPISAL